MQFACVLASSARAYDIRHDVSLNSERDAEAHVHVQGGVTTSGDTTYLPGTDAPGYYTSGSLRCLFARRDDRWDEANASISHRRLMAIAHAMLVEQHEAEELQEA